MHSKEINVLIADDEAPAIKRLRTLLSEDRRFNIVAEARNGDEVLKMIIEKSPAVAFLDINMPGASVFTTIPSLKKPPLVVFQTAYSEYGVEAFDIDAVDYLLKPVSRERFGQALSKLIQKIEMKGVSEKPFRDAPVPEPPRDFISLKTGEAITVLKINEITRLNFVDGLSFIHTKSKKLYSDLPLSHYEELLGNNGFFRVSRSDIINLKFMEKLHPFFNGQYIVEMSDGERIPVSRRRVQELKELIQ